MTRAEQAEKIVRAFSEWDHRTGGLRLLHSSRVVSAVLWGAKRYAHYHLRQKEPEGEFGLSARIGLLGLPDYYPGLCAEAMLGPLRYFHLSSAEKLDIMLAREADTIQQAAAVAGVTDRAAEVHFRRRGRKPPGKDLDHVVELVEGLGLLGWTRDEIAGGMCYSPSSIKSYTSMLS